MRLGVGLIFWNGPSSLMSPLRNVVVHKPAVRARPAGRPIPRDWVPFEPPRLSRERRRFVNETGRAVAGMLD